MRAPRRTPTIGEVLKEVLRSRGLGNASELSGLSSKWAAAVGEKVASHAGPEGLRGGTLTVVVDSSAWMNQLSMLSPEIIRKVNEALGGGKVEELRFRLGRPQAARKTTKPERFIPKKRRPLPEEMRAMEESLAEIKDEALREKARKLLNASCVREREKK